MFGAERKALVVRKRSIWKNNLIKYSLDVPNLSDNTGNL